MDCLNLVLDDISNLRMYGKVNRIKWGMENCLENCTQRIVINAALAKQIIIASAFRKIFP